MHSNPVLSHLSKVSERTQANSATYAGIAAKTSCFLLATLLGMLAQLLVKAAMAGAGMLDFIDTRLQPAMAKHDYHNPVTPLDLTLGISGCHSSFLKIFKAVAKEEQVNLFKLICEVSAINQKNPNEALIREVAAKMK